MPPTDFLPLFDNPGRRRRREGVIPRNLPKIDADNNTSAEREVDDEYVFVDRGEATVLALSNPNVLDCILRHLYNTLQPLGRCTRQARLNSYATISKSWVEPVNKQLYRNPFFGKAERGAKLERTLLHYNPKNGQYIRKLVFGEGSSTDVQSWPSPQTVPHILSAASNVRVLGFDGLQTVDLEAFKEAITSAAHLEEIRACDLMPDPWTSITHFFDTIVHRCPQLQRIRLYALHSQSSEVEAVSPHEIDGRSRGTPSDLQMAEDRVMSQAPSTARFTHVILNHCAINSIEFRNIFSNSHDTLRFLSLENPTWINHQDIAEAVEYAGKNLRRLEIESFPDEEAAALLDEEDTTHIDFTIDRIIEAAPNLIVLDFPEAVGGVKLFDAFYRSKLHKWRFTCHGQVRPEHWIDLFENKQFARGARCRVSCPDWTLDDDRHVRIEAWKHGVSWLTDTDRALDSDDDEVA